MVRNLRLAELVVLFIILPISLCFEYPISAKVTLVICSLIYAIILSKKEGLFSTSQLNFQSNHPYWKTIWIRFIPTAIILLLIMLFFKKDLLFNVVLNKPGLFVAIVFIYTFLSVFPQEFIYRVFFFKRYRTFFYQDWQFILCNAILFSLAHIMFMNIYVLALTFVGGFLFAITYLKTKSYVITSIEHSLYGLWLFTLGAGDMLAFPS